MRDRIHVAVWCKITRVSTASVGVVEMLRRTWAALAFVDNAWQFRGTSSSSAPENRRNPWKMRHRSGLSWWSWCFRGTWAGCGWLCGGSDWKCGEHALVWRCLRRHRAVVWRGRGASCSLGVWCSWDCGSSGTSERVDSSLAWSETKDERVSKTLLHPWRLLRIGAVSDRPKK